MSEATRPDLTRWNRAGLSKFTYVDGNAALDDVTASAIAFAREREHDNEKH